MWNTPQSSPISWGSADLGGTLYVESPSVDLYVKLSHESHPRNGTFFFFPKDQETVETQRSLSVSKYICTAMT